MGRVMAILLTAGAAFTGVANADETIYSYEGDVFPIAPSAGWLEFDACESQCTETIADDSFVLQWPEPGDFVNYHFWISKQPNQDPLPFWVEWRMRSNHPWGGVFVACDAAFVVSYGNILERIDMYSDAAFSSSGDFAITEMEFGEFHTFRFESYDGLNYQVSVNGIRFVSSSDPSPNNNEFMQLYGYGGCLSDQFPNMMNEWDFIRFGNIALGEQIIGAIPPAGGLDLLKHADLTTFKVTYDTANFVHVDEISVQSTVGAAPEIVGTRRGDNDEPNTVEVVLSAPISRTGTTTFTFTDGVTTNVVEYFYDPPDGDADNDGVPDDQDSFPLDPNLCQDMDEDNCDDCAIGTDDFGPLPDFDPNNDGLDSDQDGICDLGDACPTDPLKTEPGICGCGNPDTGDIDHDGVLDCIDLCPGNNDSADRNNDNVPDCLQNVPATSFWGLANLALGLIALNRLQRPTQAT